MSGTSTALVGLLAVTVALVQAPTSSTVSLPAGMEVSFVTVDELSSKKNAKGDLVRLRVSEEVRVGGLVAIPAGTAATGQIVEARAKGGMGMSGRLELRPLYLQIGGRTVRLAGGRAEKAEVEPGAVIGMFATGIAGFTGRSAVIASGTPIAGHVERTVELLVQASATGG